MANEKISFDNLEEYDGYLRNDANILKRNTNYVEGNIVNKGQVFLKCTQSGRTKSTTLLLSGVSVGNILEDGAVKWEVVSINGIPQGGSIVDWKPNHSYKENDIFVSEHQIYKVLVGFTSGSTFENIEILEDYEPEEWQPNTSYVIGDIFIESGVLYKVVNAFTSGTTFSVTSDIELYGEKEYQEGQEIITNDIVEYSGNYYKALIDFTCGKEFTKTAFEEYVPKSLTDEEIEEVIRSYTPEFSGNTGGGIELPEWEQNTEYKAGTYLVYGGTIYKVINDFTSGTTFDDTDLTSYVSPIMKGATSSANGEAGMVPESTTADVNKFLCSDGTWRGIAIKEHDEVGHITWQMHVLNGYLPLDGTALSNASTDYEELLDFAQNNNLITPDVTNLALFKYNSGTDVLTLPNFLDKGVWSGNSVEEKEAGLPNIEGTTAGAAWVANTPTSSNKCGTDVLGESSFIIPTQKITNVTTNGTGTGFYFTSIVFDASQSNSIYGNSTTVQPPAIQLIPQIRYTPYFEPQNVYSTTENRIGTWIDGKPLYQRTWQATTPSTSDNTSIISYGSDKDVKNFFGYVDDNGGRVLLNYTYASDNIVVTWCSGGYVRMRQIQYPNQPVYITLQYTKTTD